jgi:hypothetical protein
MINNKYAFKSLITDLEEIGNSAYLIQEAHEDGRNQEMLELLTHFEESIEIILEDIKYFTRDLDSFSGRL